MDTVPAYSSSPRSAAICLRSGSVRGTLLLGAATALAACSTVAGRLPPAPPVPMDVSTAARLPPYRLQVGDVLDLRLMLNPELNEEVTVRPDGHISTTVVPDQVAAGRTVPELASALRHDYSHDLQNPRISVVVKSFAPTRIYVGGQVAAPGEFITVGPTLTLSQAIARAGGTKVSGDEAHIFIVRRGANDVPEFLSTRYNAIVHGRDATADVRLAPYDLVYVPKTGINEVYDFLNSYFLQFVPVSWGFSYVVNNAPGGTTVVGTSGH